MHSFLLSDKVEGDRGKVLVVDSDPKNVRELGAALRNRGYQPLEATSFEAAKKVWIAEKPPMLIVDIRLGQFNGLHLLLRAKADRPDVSVVVTCAFADTVLEAETRRFGGTFLVKPVKPEDLTVLLGTSQPSPVERFTGVRTGERRRTLMPDFRPERRVADRRRS